MDQPETAPALTQDRKRLGPYSRGLHRAAIGQFIDGRSREGRFLRAYEAMLAQHLGGAPSSVQRAMIARAARLALYVEIMDERSLTAGGMTAHDSRQYLAWSNALRLMLREIGLKPAVERPGAALDRHLANLAAQPARADDDDDEEAVAG